MECTTKHLELTHQKVELSHPERGFQQQELEVDYQKNVM